MAPPEALGGAPRGPSATAAAAARPAAEAAAPKLLIVGPEITLSGEITACDRLVVEGSVHVTLNRTRAIEIAPSGRFTEGRAEVDEADIAGVYEGELTVRGLLLIRSTGRVSGRVRFGELEIERGGRLAGEVGGLPPESSASEAGRADADRPALAGPTLPFVAASTDDRGSDNATAAGDAAEPRLPA
jgi:cytoskeletal protein CcmA (bactofilin family)